MALQAAIFQQDPSSYGVKDYNCNIGGYGVAFQEEKPKAENLDSNGDWDSQNTYSSPETCRDSPRGKRRRRTKNMKNKEEVENQRMTHIAVERNRRKQMNDYLAVLRSLMPPSYAQRGDQASIVGGAINYVKELEQLLQFLETHKPVNDHWKRFSNFFAYPQYSTTAVDTEADRRFGIANIEVAMIDNHANIKVSSNKRPKQLLKMIAGLQSLCLTILHLNITTVDKSVLYSFSVKVEDECQLTTVNEIATAVHEIVRMTQEESMSS